MFAAVGLAAAVVVAIALATPASAGSLGGGGKTTLKSWDTDNLRFGNYSARSFAIPHLDSGERGSHAACGSGVVDGFFQLDPDVRNDLPILEVTVPASGTPAVAHRAAGTCSEFVTEQMTAVNGGRGNGLYWLDSQGVLRRGLPSHTTGRNYRTQRWSLGSQTYQSGRFRIDESVTSGSYGFGGYAARIDYYTGSASLANAEFRGAGNVSFAVPHSIELVANTQKSGSVYTWAPSFPASAGVTAATAVHLQARDYLSLCPSGFHPRGEDAARRIGNGTGRTLSSLTDATKTRLADQYWCRSDARKQIWYEPEFTSRTCGPDPRPTCPAGVTVPTKEFQAYGRVGCFFTAQGLDKTEMQRGSRAIQGTIKNTCSYMYPIPQCTENGTKKPIARAKLDSLYVAPINSPGVFPFASDGSTACDTNPRCADSGSKRDMTDAELQAYRTARGANFAPAADGSTPCAVDTTVPPPPGFADAACVTAILEIFENRPKGFNAEPGIQASHRTQTADAANPAYDLDVAAAHPGTASPPRAASDPSGCADGTESRADHGTAGSAARKNTAAAVDASLPTSSAASVSTHPPHSEAFASAGTDYTGAIRNIAHRYASEVAENNCAAKRAEAELVLSEMKARRLAFQRYIDSYESDLDAAIGVFGGYRTNTQTGSDLGLKVRQYNAEEIRRANYVALRKAHLDKLKLALADAESAYQAASSQSVTALSNSGCVAGYDAKITNLRTVQKNAETAFPSTVSSRAGISSVNAHLRNFNAQGGPDLAVGDIAFTPATLPVLSRPSSPSWSATAWPTSVTTYFCNVPAGESGYSLNSDNECTKQVPSGRRPVLIAATDHGEDADPRYSCPAGYDLSAYGCFRWVTTYRTSTGTVSTKITYSWTETYSSGPHTGTITGSYTDPTTSTTYTKTVGYSRTFTGRRSCQQASGYRSFSKRCFSYVYGASGRTPAQAKALVEGTKPAATPTPGFSPPTKPADHTNISTSWLLGKYHTQHPDRTNLAAASASDRDTAAVNLGSLSAGNIATAATGATYTPQNIARLYVPTSWTGTTAASRRSDIQTEANDYKTAYTTAYNNAYTQATTDMGTTATTSTWNRLDWRYQTSTLAWGSYQEDPATTYSGWAAQAGETEIDRDGTGCDLIAVASDGGVSVEATRLDYETSSYGKGTVFGTRTDAQRTCKIRRTRKPELLLMYAPSVVSGTDTSKTADSRLDSDSTATNAEFFYVDYQPTSAAERFKLYDEAEVFAVKASLADSPPTFCASNIPSTVYVSHAAGAMSDLSAAIDAGRLYSRISTEVLLPAGYSPSQPPTDHCFSGAFANTANVKIAVFDDTAHSAMDLVYLEKDPADTSGMTLLASGGTLTADTAVTYTGDSTQQTAFYGTTYSVPANLGATAGWDVLDDSNPATTLATEVKNRIVARDKPAVPNLPAVPASQTFEYVSAMGFNIGFLDCRPDVENVEFVGNITNATQASNQHNNYAGIKTSNSYPMSAPVWYYPAWSDLKENSLGQPRIREDGSTVAVGERSGIYTHPQSARYGWVMKTVNHIGIDKQPISAFRNQPDVRRRGTTANPARPADVTLENHRQVCFGDRTALTHYTSSAATADPLGHSTDNAPQQAVVVWSAHNPICDNSDVCDTWQTRCYRNAQTPAEAEQVDCPPTGQPLPADTTRYPDKAMVDANIVRVITDSDLSDTETAAAEAAKLISYKAEVSDGTTTQPRWPWLVPGKQNIFDCETRWWYCLRTKVTLHGIDQYEWLKTRQLRIAFQYTLPKWGNVLVSTLDRETEDEQAVKLAVNILIQTVRIGL